MKPRPFPEPRVYPKLTETTKQLVESGVIKHRVERLSDEIRAEYMGEKSANPQMAFEYLLDGLNV